MCEWEAVIWGCGHIHRRKIKYCHEARNRTPYHECYRTGNRFWEEESIDRSGREWEIPEENCTDCIEKGMRRYRHQEEEPEPVMEDSKGYYADGELEAASALEISDRTVGANGRVFRFTPLPIQKLVEECLSQTNLQCADRYRVLPVRKRSIQRYDRPKRSYALQTDTCRKLAINSQETEEAMDLDRPT